MLDRLKELKRYKLIALDGEIGSVEEIFFDDRHWTIRYLVADTGNWLSERSVLISPMALASVNREEQTITVNQTLKQIEEGPTLEAHKPVSRQFEESYHDHNKWPAYWGGSFAWGAYLYVEQARDQMDRIRKVEGAWDHHLRSTKDVTGYDLRAEDGEIGQVEDFIVEESTWTLRYVVVETRNWWGGRHVLVSPRWIDKIEWSERTASALLTRESVRTAPDYTKATLLTREYETQLHEHYERIGYWNKDQEPNSP